MLQMCNGYSKPQLYYECYIYNTSNFDLLDRGIVGVTSRAERANFSCRYNRYDSIIARLYPSSDLDVLARQQQHLARLHPPRHLDVLPGQIRGVVAQQKRDGSDDFLDQAVALELGENVSA